MDGKGPGPAGGWARGSTESERADGDAEKRVARQEVEAAAENREARLVAADQTHFHVSLPTQIAELHVAPAAGHVVAARRLFYPGLNEKSIENYDI